MMKYGILCVICLMLSALDVVTGYITALITKTVKSSIMRKGLLRKAVIMLVLGAMALLQFAQKYADLGINIPILTTACTFVIIMEATSILENANNATGGKLTDLIKKVFNNEK